MDVLPMTSCPMMIPKELKDKLDSLKLVEREPYYCVIERLIRCWEFDNKIFDRANGINQEKAEQLKNFLVLDGKTLLDEETVLEYPKKSKKK